MENSSGTPKHVMCVFENDKVIEQVPVNNWQHARKLQKELEKKYKDQKRTVRVRDGYIGVSEELFNKTKALLDDIANQYPDVLKPFVKDYPEFRHLGYDLKKGK